MSKSLVAHRKFQIKNVNPSDDGGRDKESTKLKTDEYLKRIGELQPKLYAEGKRGLVIVLQGMDTSGKDGATRKLLEYVNPAGVECTSFKVPSAEERAHDYLWRIHRALPRLGNLGIWNRSHYEDVLVVRVLELVPSNVWKDRYDQINAFENLLTDNGYVFLKFFLHISREEQAERLQERLDDKTKHWKFAPGDLKTRERWDDYQSAYEEVLRRCSTPYAPWHVVPANRNWYRDFLISRSVCEVLEKMDLRWPPPATDLKGVRIV